MRGQPLLLALCLAAGAAGAGFLAGKMARSNDNPGEIAANAEARSAATRLLARTLPTATGTFQPLRQWQGKTLVVNFWATWCPPCREEMPAFSRLQTRLQEKNVQFVGIAIDTSDNVRKFAESVPITYPLLIADAETIALAKQLGNPQLALPFTVIIGPDGTPQHTRLGSLGERELEHLLTR